MIKATLKFLQNKKEYQKLEKTLRPIQMKVGWFENLSYGINQSGESIKVATVAAYNEFGHDNIPPRPFMRPARDNNLNKWKQVLIKTAQKGDLVNAFDVLGLIVAGDIRQAIINVQTPPLAPATIKARKRKYASVKSFEATIEKPLIDTGLMISSVSHKTEVKK